MTFGAILCAGARCVKAPAARTVVSGCPEDSADTAGSMHGDQGPSWMDFAAIMVVGTMNG